MSKHRTKNLPLTSEKSDSKKKLPAKGKDKIIEVNLKEVIFGFMTVFGTTFILVSGMMYLRDFWRFRRQQALIEGAKEILYKFRRGGDTSEKD